MDNRFSLLVEVSKILLLQITINREGVRYIGITEGKTYSYIAVRSSNILMLLAYILGVSQPPGYALLFSLSSDGNLCSLYLNSMY